MSHNIKHATYPENVNKNKVQKEWDHYVKMEDWQEGSGGLPNKIRWIEDTIYASRSDAYAAIAKMDKGWYDQLAVKFYESDIDPSDHHWIDLNERMAAATKELENRKNILYPATLQSNLITCKNCNSKLARTYLNSNFCPVCNTDLRPESMKTSIKAAKSKYDHRVSEIEKYKSRHKKVNWLVKIEYHT